MTKGSYAAKGTTGKWRKSEEILYLELLESLSSENDPEKKEELVKSHELAKPLAQRLADITSEIKNSIHYLRELRKIERKTRIELRQTLTDNKNL